MTVHAFDSTGNERWRSTITKPHNILQGYQLLQTMDGGIAILAQQTFSKGYQDFYPQDQNDLLIKTDSLGQIVFEKTNGRLSKSFDFLVETPDSGFLAAVHGSSSGDQFQTLYRLDKAGNVVWTRPFQDNPNLRFTAARTVSATEILLAGYRKNVTGADEIFFSKVNSLGGLIWERVLSSGSKGQVNSIEPLPSGGYLLAGSLASQFSILETDANGSTVQLRSYGGETAYSAQARDGGWIAAGRGVSGAPTVIKTDTLGNMLWAVPQRYNEPNFVNSAIYQGPGKFVFCAGNECFMYEDPDYILP